ncbi:MAG: HEPN domain-containing protein, partial [Candidatus Aenigmarchaeota archaeon]|nr:HEPN domain-containing protein [Candidatus Aenigmarchaeota archaeon]
MAKQGFLVKLAEEGKLGMVEPSEEIKNSYIKKSESYLESARILLERGKLEESVSMAYYSMYHVLTALLFRTGI